MAYGDGTGPFGAGPMTGRSLGWCAGTGVPGFSFAGGGRGGRGHRNWYRATGLTRWQRAACGPGVPPVGAWQPPAWSWAAPTREQRAAALKAQAEWLEEALSRVRDQLGTLEREEQE